MVNALKIADIELIQAAICVGSDANNAKIRPVKIKNGAPGG